MIRAWPGKTVPLVRQARPAHMAQPRGVARGVPHFAPFIAPIGILLTWFGSAVGIDRGRVGVNGITPATWGAQAAPRFISGDAIQVNPDLQTACVSSEFEIRTFAGPTAVDRAFAIAHPVTGERLRRDGPADRTWQRLGGDGWNETDVAAATVYAWVICAYV